MNPPSFKSPQLSESSFTEVHWPRLSGSNFTRGGGKHPVLIGLNETILKLISVMSYIKYIFRIWHCDREDAEEVC